MNNDFLLNDDESLISSFDGSFRKALNEKEDSHPEQTVPKKKKEKSMKNREVSRTVDSLTSGNIQIRVSSQTLLLLKKHQMSELERCGKSKSMKQLIDEIVTEFFSKKK